MKKKSYTCSRRKKRCRLSAPYVPANRERPRKLVCINRVAREKKRKIGKYAREEKDLPLAGDVFTLVVFLRVREESRDSRMRDFPRNFFFRPLRSIKGIGWEIYSVVIGARSLSTTLLDRVSYSHVRLGVGRIMDNFKCNDDDIIFCRFLIKLGSLLHCFENPVTVKLFLGSNMF